MKIVEVQQHAGDNVGHDGMRAAFDAEKVIAVLERSGFRDPSKTTLVRIAHGHDVYQIETVESYDGIMAKIGWKK